MTQQQSTEDLMHHVAELAVRLRDGEDVAAELVTSARGLRYAFETARDGCRSGYRNPNVRRPTADTALDLDLVPDSSDVRIAVMNWVAAPERGFVHATAGQLRRLFPATTSTSTDKWIGAHSLVTLPLPVPADDAAPVVVYTAGIAVGGLLWATARHEDTAAAVKLLIDRVAHKRVLPWEDPYAFRD